ncbi:kinase-like domain-containing protein [Mycena galopus ATCC 62051]|nr:kinase-like domain-containing protein [Mycena galopus ATCC 62051]
MAQGTLSGSSPTRVVLPVPISGDAAHFLSGRTGLPNPTPITTASFTFSPARKIILDCIDKKSMDRLKIPQNFMVFAFSLPLLQLSQGQITKIRELLQDCAGWDLLESIANYHSVVETLFEILENTGIRDSPESGHPEKISQSLYQDAYVLHDQLLSIFRDPETYRTFLTCRGDLAQRLIDLLQDVLDSLPEISARSKLSKALLRLSCASGLHPTCLPLKGLHIGRQVGGGAFSDIRKGLLVRGQTVCVKIMRFFEPTQVKAAAQEFGREALIWRQLSHPNLLPFFGLHYWGSRLCLVSPWMPNGHILQFLETAPPDTDRVCLILDVAMGLEYLHGKHVVHGDLKGTNILVTPSRRACVADFGLSSIVDAMSLRLHSTASPKGGTARYQAPELLLFPDIPNHFESDVYAFGCVCYEMFTGKAPFHDVPRDVTVGIKVLEGFRPSRPEPMLISDTLWSLIQNCWEAKSCDRPSVSAIVQQLVDPAIGAKTVESAPDWDETFSSRSRRSLQNRPLLPSITAIQRRIFGRGALSALASHIETSAATHHAHLRLSHILDCPNPTKARSPNVARLPAPLPSAVSRARAHSCSSVLAARQRLRVY